MFKFNSIMPLSWFKKNTTKALNELQETSEPLILTVHGQGVLAVLDLDTFTRMQDQADRYIQSVALDQTLRKMEAELR